MARRIRRTNRKNSKRLNSRRRTNRKNSKRLNSRRRSKVLNRKRTMKRSNVKYQKGGNLVMVDGRETKFTYETREYECLLVGNTLPLFIGDKIKVEFETLPKELDPVSLGSTVALGKDFDYEETINGEYELPFSASELGIQTKISLKDVKLKIIGHEKIGPNRPKNTEGEHLNDTEILDIIKEEAAAKKAAEEAAEEAVNSPEAIKIKQEIARSNLIKMIMDGKGETRMEIYEKGDEINMLLDKSTYDDKIELNIELDEPVAEDPEGRTLRKIIKDNFGQVKMDTLIIRKINENAEGDDEW